MYLKSYFETKRALGSDCTINLVAEQNPADIFAKLWLKIFTFEKQFSRFLEESELNTLNRRAGVKTGISPDMYKILSASSEVAAVTGGHYNPFILPALQRAGYQNSRTPGEESLAAPDYSKRHVVPYEKMKLNSASVLIPAGSALDLGGIGKGYLAEQLQIFLDSLDLAGYWVSLGGDVVGGGKNENYEPWQVTVSDGKRPLRTLTMNDSRFAIATSGTLVHGGKRWHHIIDPTTGLSVKNPYLSATVTHLSATWADVLASLAIDPRVTSKQLFNLGASGLIRVTADGKIVSLGACKQRKVAA